jgi:hypothetical protein
MRLTARRLARWIITAVRVLGAAVSGLAAAGALYARAHHAGAAAGGPPPARRVVVHVASQHARAARGAGEWLAVAIIAIAVAGVVLAVIWLSARRRRS